jgi:hypothetical protein
VVWWPKITSAVFSRSGTGPIFSFRRTGTATVRLAGSRAAEGTFPAVCGAFLVKDAPKIGRAGDGLLFETCIPGVGRFQLQATRRVPGPAREASLELTTDEATWIGSGPDNHVAMADDLFGAAVQATLRPARAPAAGGPGGAVEIEARFDCPK